MVSPFSPGSYEQAHFTVTLSGKTGFWWLGLRAQGGPTGGVDYFWENDAPLTFTHWDRDQPGTASQYESCILVSSRPPLASRDPPDVRFCVLAVNSRKISAKLLQRWPCFVQKTPANQIKALAMLAVAESG